MATPHGGALAGRQTEGAAQGIGANLCAGQRAQHACQSSAACDGPHMVQGQAAALWQAAALGA